MKKILAIIMAVVLCMTIAGCSAPTENAADTNEYDVGGTLNLYTWEGMFPQEILDGFAEETGIDIIYNNFDFDETMLAKLQAAGGGDYDLVIADDYIIEMAIAEGLVQKLDKSKIPSLGNVNPVYTKQFFDPTDEYTVPYGAGVQTIIYDPALFDVEIKGYADLWNAAFEDNVGLIGNYRVIDGMALKVMGESYNTEDTAVIEAAGQKLLELAPNIRLIKDEGLQEDLISGEVGAGVVYTSQVTMAKMAKPELEIVYPEEGLGFGIMSGFIPSQAPNPNAAHAFLEYILDPERAAACFEFLGYYCTTLPAEEFIAEDMKEFLTIPSDFDTSKMEMIENVSAETLELHEQIWTAFKAECE